ncbi:MAG: OmpA family protein, partial [Acidobacteriota bacterium]
KKQETASKSRLQDALSYVGEVRQSDRGLVLNLPGILFRSNEASLRPEAGLAFSKLAGILLLRPELHATIEGHTDSTGSAEHNLRLSQDRAAAVSDFLEGQAVPAERLEAIGYGMDRPIADNRTPEGRRRNRRVEILIRERRDISN